jgi:hypothetical protein
MILPLPYLYSVTIRFAALLMRGNSHAREFFPARSESHFMRASRISLCIQESWNGGLVLPISKSRGHRTRLTRSWVIEGFRLGDRDETARSVRPPVDAVAPNEFLAALLGFGVETGALRSGAAAI